MAAIRKADEVATGRIRAKNGEAAAVHLAADFGHRFAHLPEAIARGSDRLPLTQGFHARGKVPKRVERSFF